VPPCPTTDRPSAPLTERQAFLVLNALPSGSIARHRLLEEFGGDPRAALAGRNLWPPHFDLGREEEALGKSGTDFITLRDRNYPPVLRQIPDPPLVLYRQGPYAFDRPAVAIVGSRRATLYGRAVARELGSELARLGFGVVSGLARGVDTAAHQGALESGGRTVAVLGTGIGTVYPPENRPLFRRIAEQGAILSEFPFGSPGGRHTFPMRNRIVSGLSAAVIVVESDVDGGAMITARLAGEQGRMVLAVPGRIDQPTSAGCHQLIRDGATLLTGVEDVLEELNYLEGFRPKEAPARRRRSGEAKTELTPDEARILGHFRGGAVLGPDALAARGGLPAAGVAAALMMLELKGRVAKRLDGAYEALP
jgi:DNA processing protein